MGAANFSAGVGLVDSASVDSNTYLLLFSPEYHWSDLNPSGLGLDAALVLSSHEYHGYDLNSSCLGLDDALVQQFQANQYSLLPSHESH